MSTVNTEGKLEWYLAIELSLRSICAYLQLGLSLGAVQLRHACVPLYLALYKFRCWWRRTVAGTAEDGVLYLSDTESDAVTTDPSSAESTEARQQGAFLRPIRPQADSLVTPHVFLAELLAKFDQLAAITHGEAADVRLMMRMMQQDIFAQTHRRQQAAAGVAVDTTQPSEQGSVFCLSETDATYAALTAAGLPTAITYRDFVTLATLLSEAMAWDLLWMHAALDDAANCTGAAAREDGGPRTEADSVAVMLPNSVEYNAIWMAAARSGPLHTFLDVLYRPNINNNNISSGMGGGGTYRPCRTALLNTNLASNAMLYHALECSGSVMVVMDAAYVPLLFIPCDDGLDESKGNQKDGRLRLHVPPHVRRIYLWRASAADGEPLKKSMTSEMEMLLKEFNTAAYTSGHTASTYDSSSCWGSGTESNGAAAAPAQPLTAPPTPPLDLYDAVKVFYARAQATPSFTVPELRHTNLITSANARPLVHNMLARPPPGWASLLSPHPPGSASTAAHSAQRRQKLERYKARVAATLSTLLCRFHHTQPVLLIYTSGTTGLPKAARFSHLRFFATGFLSRVLYYRERIAETVVEKLAEARFVEQHPDAVLQCALADATAAGAAASGDCEEAEGQEPDAVSGAASGCPPIPRLFGSAPLDRTRRPRSTPEATLAILCNMVRWCCCYLSYLCGHEYMLTAALDKLRYTADELRAVEEEQRLITIYNCLPMYHTVGSVFCLGHLLHALEEQHYAWSQRQRFCPARTLLAMTVPTVRMVLRTKFSASQFRKDLQRYHVTVVQYIGEVLRYAVLYERSHAPKAAAAAAATAAAMGGEGSSGDGAGSTPAIPAAVAEAVALADANRTSWRVPYAFGNGLRHDIWLECMRRLNVAHPVEFYSSTEGNIFLLNLFNMPGVIGHIPRFPGPLSWLSMQYFPLFPFRVLRFDEAAQQVYRDPVTNYCAHCPVGEVGEVVGEVIDGFDLFALRRFDGYHKAKTSTDKHGQHVKSDGGSTGTTTTTAAAASAVSDKAKRTCNGDAAGPGKQEEVEEDVAARQSKVIRHVLWPYQNDCYFLSGDLIRMDSYGFCTFVDRVGDTFRWKGENVSTLEVSNALNSVHTRRVGVREAVVYGVQLPGREGRAGMALLSLQPTRLPDAATRSSSGGVESSEGGDGATTPHAVSLAQERLFLQDALYAFLAGKVRRNGDGTASNATLPAYAIPLFIRVQEAPPQDDDDEGHHEEEPQSATTRAPSAAAVAEATEEATQTTTFKYKRGLLMKQGFRFEGSSTVSDEVPAEGWGGGPAGESQQPQQQEEEAMTTTPWTRVYVLVLNASVFKALSVRSEKEGVAGEAVAGDGGQVAAGYVPLTKKSLALLGENFDKCGW